MTKTEKIIIEVLKNYKKYVISMRMTNKGTIAFLTDEFAYQLENDKNFNEQKFRDEINKK